MAGMWVSPLRFVVDDGAGMMLTPRSSPSASPCHIRPDGVSVIPPGGVWAVDPQFPADEGGTRYCQLVAAGGAFGRWEIEIAQAAVAALHSLKECSRNSR